ncbi:esterase [Mycobacteroides immunogenum]|uniref:Esterase n=1 Tax=Mycobacteroides immunogenum TaxID=83262 RepID=A0A7V8LJR3_9MYCO|nr:esterase [Mycobacteroides immunogenum]ANO02681.1 esterase [Mycobacteroides immunogenum]KIU38150.1 esterase [Mycobacteroides immunogenum]KPG02459.1 esterase [Mycobacteroides immunogenum]KPG03038.1 esterase [Mycobacteroides immunogenum]
MAEVSPLSRRQLLRAGAALGAGAALLPTLAPPAQAFGEVTTGSFVSAARGGVETGYKIARPPGADGPLRPVILLHGRDETADRMIGWGFENIVGGAGGAAVAVAAIDGGNSYWHPHESGDDPGAMIINEFLPLLADEGMDTSRVAFLGWSAGGYGALLNGARLGGPRTAAIAAVGPALWTTYDAATPDAFDGPKNWSDYSVFNLPQLDTIPLWVSCGTEDRFYEAAKLFASERKTPPAGSFGPGGHDGDYWDTQVSPALSWIAPILAG